MTKKTMNKYAAIEHIAAECTKQAEIGELLAAYHESMVDWLATMSPDEIAQYAEKSNIDIGQYIGGRDD